MSPTAVLERALHYLDRAHDRGFRTKAFVRALDVVRGTPADELAARAAAGTLTELDGIGDTSAGLITAAIRGETDLPYLRDLDAATQVPITDAGRVYRDALRGDCHLHSRWSDGGAEVEAMAETAIALGHEYMVLTDHSARLTIAHGLDRERLGRQLEQIAVLNGALAPFRILTGMEVDILEDGSLDLAVDLLERLDVVVASVHSKLRMEQRDMTKRMLAAVVSPHVDILGHCTGRMIGRRPPSTFDADVIFSACAQFETAVEINCRPERLDPPGVLLDLAVAYDVYVAIDSDAHATGQLEWQPHGCDRAAEHGVRIDRIINTWPVDDLLAWAAGHPTMPG